MEAGINLLGLVVLGAICVVANFYFIQWQTYVLKVEVLLHGVAAVFTAAEVLVLLAGDATLLCKRKSH